ncbi:MAG: hypothetical protein AAFU85_17025 [Planctomycetota bacterium]
MTNPYEPPQRPIRFAPFHRRFLRGVQLAVAAYASGLKQERISPLQHVISWCALLLVSLVVILWLVGILYGFYYSVSNRGF